jgi:hypothetical protein
MMATERMPAIVVVTTEKMAKKKWIMGASLVCARGRLLWTSFNAEFRAHPVRVVQALPNRRLGIVSQEIHFKV